MTLESVVDILRSALFTCKVGYNQDGSIRHSTKENVDLHIIEITYINFLLYLHHRYST